MSSLPDDQTVKVSLPCSRTYITKKDNIPQTRMRYCHHASHCVPSSRGESLALEQHYMQIPNNRQISATSLCAGSHCKTQN
eukprot:1159412-Pelagomonas_calceolata.AAC.6